jgi:hypothetical protein
MRSVVYKDRPRHIHSNMHVNRTIDLKSEGIVLSCGKRLSYALAIVGHAVAGDPIV